MWNTRKGEHSPGATEARLDILIESAPEWSEDLGIPKLAESAASRARAILALIDDPAAKDDKLRIFPSESAGLSIQNRSGGETRVLEVNPNSLVGEIHDRVSHSHSYYTLDSDRSAAAFLMAS